jgi:hypothetical protein
VSPCKSSSGTHQLSVGTYGRWLRKKAVCVVRLANTNPEAIGGKVVAEATCGSYDSRQVVEGVDLSGDPGRARTFNPEIKSDGQAQPRSTLEQPRGGKREEGE